MQNTETHARAVAQFHATASHLQNSFHDQRRLGVSRDDCYDHVAHGSRVARPGLRLLQQEAAHVQQRYGGLPGLEHA